MSRYPVIETPQRVPSLRRSHGSTRSTILIKEGVRIQVIDADMVQPPGKVSLTLQTESGDPGTRDLMPDVRMTQELSPGMDTGHICLSRDHNHNYASSAASDGHPLVA